MVSQLQIAIMGQQLMLWLNKEQVVLSREEARILHEQLEMFLEQQHEERSFFGKTTGLQDQLALAHQSAPQGHQQKMNELFSLARQSNGIEKAWQHGLSTFGEKAFFDLISCCWEVDHHGWGHLKNDAFKPHMLSLLSLTAWAFEGHVLDRLWRTGAFDTILIGLGDALPSPSVPNPIFGRMLRLLTQEQPISAGSFWMGSNSSEAWPFEQPEHLVKLTRSFSAMLFPVTQLLYQSVMQCNPSSFEGATRPVESVSWREALIFCNALSQQQGYQPAYERLDSQVPYWNEHADGYRLPTEAEWEFMALSASDFHFSGSHDADEVAWFASNARGRTHGVGLKSPNLLGMYDLSGNVWEWCWDGYSAQFYSKEECELDPRGEMDSLERVCRGGGFSSEKESLRLKIRGRFPMEHRWNGLGFRLVRSLFLD